MGPQKKQIQLLENMVNVLDTYKKKKWLHLKIMLEGSKNPLILSSLEGAI